METEKKQHVRIYPDYATEPLSRPVVSTLPGVASQVTKIFSEEEEKNRDIIVHRGGVCEGILTLVNGAACSGNLARQMCEPQKWEQKRHSAGGDGIRHERDECNIPG